ncbi:MAG: methyltransferase domain-containing protein [Moraxellaceae bacterium]|nr:methyltransferase domain-containing protein [Moraxellaceae bacterium]
MSAPLSRKQEIAGRFSRAALHYEQHAGLQQQIAAELLTGLTPAGVVLDAGCGTGRESLLLAGQAAVERVVALDLSSEMLACVPPHPRVQTLQGDVEALPLPAAGIDQVFSNFALQWCSSREQAAAELARVLKPGGPLAFSVPGPGSLAALVSAKVLAVNHFAGESDWAMALMSNGFSDCEFFQGSFAMHFATPRELLLALKQIGANTADVPREAHLHGRGWWQRVSAALESMREPEGIPLRYEVLFVRARRDGDE